MFFGTRKRTLSANKKQEEDNNTNLPIIEQIRVAFNNGPFLFVIGIYLCSWLGVQLTASILPYFVINWMGLPESTFPQVAIAVQGTALTMLFVWSFVSKNWGRKLFILWVFVCG